MADETAPDGSRRRFLKRSAVVGGTALVGGLAGCTGNNGGSGGSGGGSSGGSDGGSGSSGGSGATSSPTATSTSNRSGNLKTLKMVIPPLGVAMVTLGHIQDETNILEKELSDAGYKADITKSWDDTTLFAAGKADLVPTLSDLEGARIAARRNMPVTFHGLAFTNYEGLYIKKGSKYDPDNTGGVDATITQIQKDGALWANAGWNQASVGPAAIIMQEKYGFDYGPDKNDFKVKSSDWSTLPKLLAQGKADMVTNAPPLGSAVELAKDNPPIKAIMWYQPHMKELGYGPDTINIGNFGTTKKFSDNNMEAIKAFMRAWKKGAQYTSNPDNFDTILSNQKYVDALGGNNKKESRIILEFSQNPPKWSQTKPGNPAPVLVSDIEIDDAYVKRDKKALSKAHDLGLLPDGWDKNISYKTVSL